MLICERFLPRVKARAHEGMAGRMEVTVMLAMSKLEVAVALEVVCGCRCRVRPRSRALEDVQYKEHHAEEHEEPGSLKLSGRACSPCGAVCASVGDGIR